MLNFTWKDIVHIKKHDVCFCEEFPISGHTTIVPTNNALTNKIIYELDDFINAAAKKHNVNPEDIELLSLCDDPCAFIDASSMKFKLSECGCYINGISAKNINAANLVCNELADIYEKQTAAELGDEPCDELQIASGILKVYRRKGDKHEGFDITLVPNDTDIEVNLVFVETDEKGVVIRVYGDLNDEDYTHRIDISEEDLNEFTDVHNNCI